MRCMSCRPSERHCTLLEVAASQTTGVDYHLMDQLGDIFESTVDEMTTGMTENALVQLVL